MNFQRIEKYEDSILGKARRYYTILFAVNDIRVTRTELDLLATSALLGEVDAQAFCKEFGGSVDYIYTVVHKLKKLGLLFREGKRVKVVPSLSLDFTKDLLMAIKIHGNE